MATIDRRATDDSEERLREVLRALPRPGASLGFRSRVMARIERSPGPPSTAALGVRAFAAVTAAVLVVLALVLLVRGRPFDESAAAPERAVAVRERPSTEELQELKARFRALERELDALRHVAREVEPVVGIEGPSADYLIDLRDLAETAPAGGVARPASFRERR